MEVRVANLICPDVLLGPITSGRWQWEMEVLLLSLMSGNLSMDMILNVGGVVLCLSFCACFGLHCEIAFSCAWDNTNNLWIILKTK